VIAINQYWYIPHLKEILASPIIVAPLIHVEKYVKNVKKKLRDLFATAYSSKEATDFFIKKVLITKTTRA
jgi:hypothetical protein